jgi:hypothetical protein
VDEAAKQEPKPSTTPEPAFAGAEEDLIKAGLCARGEVSRRRKASSLQRGNNISPGNLMQQDYLQFLELGTRPPNGDRVVAYYDGVLVGAATC